MANRRMNQRRRRVVLEEVTQSARQASHPGESPATVAESDSSRETGAKVYSNSAQRRYQKKTTDLIPKRYRAVTLVTMLLVACVCGLNLLSAYSSDWQDQLTTSQLQAFALSGQGSLSGWFCSFLLVLASLASLQLYALRQHRCDDYRGTYRLWGWMAPLFLLASIQCSVDLVGLLQSVVSALFGSLPGEGLVWLVAAKLLLLSALVVRGLFEVRASRVALTGAVLGWIALTTAVVLQIPGVGDHLALDVPLYYGNSLLIGISTVFMSVIVYARFVFLHSNGLLATDMAPAQKGNQSKPEGQQMKKETKAKQEKKRPEKKNREASPAEIPTPPVPASVAPTEKASAPAAIEEPGRVNVPQVERKQGKQSGKKPQASTPLGSRIKKKQAPSSDFSFDLEQDEIEMFHLLEKEHLSKSERRRLRKLQKRQNRAA